MKKWFLTGILNIWILTGVSCGPKAEVDYFPITANSYWEYDITYVLPAMGSKDGIYKGEVVGSETLNGRDYFKVEVESSGVPGEEKRIEYLRKAPDGVYRILDSDETRTEHLLMPNPLEIGKTWTVIDPDGEVEFQVESLESVEVGGQIYKDCFKIGFRGEMEISDQLGTATGVSYRAPNVGEVKSEIAYTFGDNMTITIDMTRKTIRH